MLRVEMVSAVYPLPPPRVKFDLSSEESAEIWARKQIAESEFLKKSRKVKKF